MDFYDFEKVLHTAAVRPPRLRKRCRTDVPQIRTQRKPPGGWNRAVLPIPHVGMYLCNPAKERGIVRRSAPSPSPRLRIILCIVPKSPMFCPGIPRALGSPAEKTSPLGAYKQNRALV